MSAFQERRCLQDFLKENERKVNLKDADVVLMRRRMPTLEKAKKKKSSDQERENASFIIKNKAWSEGYHCLFFVSPAGLFYNK